MDTPKNDFKAEINQFATKFHCVNYSQGERPKNSVSSGLSAELVLALLTLGTEDETHNELLAEMKLPDDDALRSIFAGISAEFKGARGVTLSIANKIYVQDGDYQLKSKFKEDAEKVFGAEVEKCKFANASAAAATINSWVSDKTNHKIKNTVSPDLFIDDTIAEKTKRKADKAKETKIILINALYFKGMWATKFDPKDTYEEDFYVSKDTKVPCAMMHNKSNFKYGKSDVLDSQLLEMEYKGGDASLLIVLPNTVDGLPELMSKILQHPELIDLPLKKTNVKVTIPKFIIESEIDMKSFLPEMGISRIFDGLNYDIKKILEPEEPLFVSKAEQKAFIEINEEGTEAAAVTFMKGRRPLRMPKYPAFSAKHPFFYALRVKDYRLFVGTFEGEECLRTANQPRTRIVTVRE